MRRYEYIRRVGVALYLFFARCPKHDSAAQYAYTTKIKNHYDNMTVTKLMFLRNSVIENSPIMAMISKMDKKEEDKIISIWTMIVNEVPYSCEQEHILFVTFIYYVKSPRS